MTDSFAHAKYSVAWAKNRVSEFRGKASAFVQSNPYAYRVESDPDTGEKVHKIVLTKEMPFSLPGLASDIVHNLRSALDQAGFACNPKGKYTAFPFANSAANIDGQIKGRSKELPKEIQDLMRSFQPYRGGDDLLWALNELSNTNKHAIVCPIGTRTGAIGFGPLNVSGGFTVINEGWNSDKDEMILARVAKGATFNAQMQVAIHIAISDVEIVKGQPALTVLNSLAGKVESIVMALEAEAKRLGLVP